MSFKLSRRSLDRLEGIDDRLQEVVKMAITLSKTDFGVVQGMRTIEQQKELVAKGASKTMKSKHLEGKAFDIMAFVNGRASWELNLYDEIADAFLSAAKEVGCELTWGAAWHKKLTGHEGTCEALMMEYVDLRRSQGRRPFLDGPHFQLET